jgi:uncharacterized protein (DUF488 family)
MAVEIFTLGHSSLSFERFVELLANVGVNAVADVRSSPFSKHSPWFNQPEMKTALRKSGIAYVFLGGELGGRPRDPSLFSKGIADYSAMAETTDFRAGLDRLIMGLKRHRIAMICSERDPLHCHRCLLVSRQLALRDVGIRHILANGLQETQTAAEDRLLIEENLAADDFLYPRSARLDEAYTRRNRQVAYTLTSSKPMESQCRKHQ